MCEAGPSIGPLRVGQRQSTYLGDLGKARARCPERQTLLPELELLEANTGNRQVLRSAVRLSWLGAVALGTFFQLPFSSQLGSVFLECQS